MAISRAMSPPTNPTNSGGAQCTGGRLARSISATRVAAAHGRLAEELRLIALDLLGLYDSDELPAECAAWVRITVDAAVDLTSDHTVSSVVTQLRAALATAPADVTRHIGDASRRHEAGYA